MTEHDLPGRALGRAGRSDSFLRRSVLSLLAVLAVSACNMFQELPFWDVVNQTDQTLTIVGLMTEEHGFDPPGEVELAVLAPGEVYTTSGADCSDLVIVARTEEGEEFAREPHPMCDDDEWVITGLTDPKALGDPLIGRRTA